MTNSSDPDLPNEPLQNDGLRRRAEFPLSKAIGLLFLLILSVFGGMVFCHSERLTLQSPFRMLVQARAKLSPGIMQASQHPRTEMSPGEAPSMLQSNQVLIYGTGNGYQLKPHIVRFPRSLDPHTKLHLALEELIRAATSNQGKWPLPSGSQLRGVYIDSHTAVIDLTGAITRPLGGPMTELLCVYSLVNTAAKNAPGVRQVKILINGSAARVLWDCVDITEPLAPDLSLAQN